MADENGPLFHVCHTRRWQEWGTGTVTRVFAPSELVEAGTERNHIYWVDMDGPGRGHYAAVELEPVAEEVRGA